VKAIGLPAVATHWTSTSDWDIHAFVRGTDNHLYDDHWNGTQWRWEDYGTPPGTTIASDPAALTWLNSFAYIPLLVFVRGANGHLYDAYRSAPSPTTPGTGPVEWQDMGVPPGTLATGRPATVMFADSSAVDPQAGGVLEVYGVVVRGSDGHLYGAERHIDSVGEWTWYDLGRPAANVVGDPGVHDYYAASLGTYNSAYVFVVGSDNHLYTDRWYGGSMSRWWDAGTSPQSGILGSPSVVVSNVNSYPRLYAFAATGGSLCVKFFNGSVWNWASQSAPRGSNVTGAPGTAAGQNEKLYAFIRGTDNHLYMDYWNGSVWSWVDQGPQPSAAMASDPVVVQSRFQGSFLIYTFVIGSDGHLRVNFQNGTRWLWADQGMP
jgi:hypothetical protein